MLTVQLDDFMVELKDGSYHHVGASNKTGTAKLYDVTDTEAREFGDERIKLVFEDDAGSTVEVALSPDAASAIVTAIESLSDGPVFQ